MQKNLKIEEEEDLPIQEEDEEDDDLEDMEEEQEDDENDDDVKNQDQEGEENEEDDLEDDDEEEGEEDQQSDAVPSGGFTITEDPSYENYHPEKILKKIEEKKKEKKQKQEEIDFDDKNLPAAKVIKPFDYEKLRKETKQKGTVYVQKTHSLFPRVSDAKSYFQKFGNITKIEPDFKNLNKFNKEKGKTETFRAIIGYYIQFDNKNDAKKLATMMNGQPMNAKSMFFYSLIPKKKIKRSNFGKKNKIMHCYQSDICQILIFQLK